VVEAVAQVAAVEAEHARTGQADLAARGGRGSGFSSQSR
jgi:hypothetical protein